MNTAMALMLSSSFPVYLATAAKNQATWPLQWTVLVLATMAVGLVTFLLYRWVDLLQLSFIGEQQQPTDLEKMTPEVFADKKKRKLERTRGQFFKRSGSWIVQVLYVIPGMALAVYGLRRVGLQDGTIYTVLMVTTFFVNMLISKMFSLWNPWRPSITFGYHQHRTWTWANMGWQAWGILTWAIPTYFFYQWYGVSGWQGSVIFMVLSQLAQLVFFIYTIKKQAIPYQQYDGFSADFKRNLHNYLQSQGIKDEEVGVIRNMGVGPNAFATSITGLYRQIVITEEMIKGFPDPTNPKFTLKLSEDSLEAVIAHEVGHIRHHHVEKSVFIGLTLSALVTVGVYYIFGKIDPSSFYFPKDMNSQLLLYWGQSLFNVMLVYPLTFFMIGFTRSNEYQADTHLLETNGCKRGWEFFHQIRHIAPVPNHPYWDRCNATHPEPKHREERMKEWEKEHCR